MRLMPSEVARYRQAIVIDAMTVHARLLAVLDHLEQSTGGYPATASGADGNGGGNTELTTVEAAADANLTGRNDQAADAQAKIEHQLVEAANNLRILTTVINGWWTPDSDAGRHSDAAARVHNDNDACPNHRKYGIHEPRAQGRTHCRWCYETSIARNDKDELLYGGELPDRELVEYRQRYGRVTTREYDAFARRVADRQALAKAARRPKGKRRKGAAA